MQLCVRILLAAVLVFPALAETRKKDIQDVPEPSGYVLIGTGLIAISFIGRRKGANLES